MTRALAAVILAVSLAGCMATYRNNTRTWAQGMTAGQIGCRDTEIAVDELKFTGSDPTSWRATCKDKVVWCSSSNGNVSCAPEMP